MSDLTLRNVKGTPLTNQEVDDNFSNLNADKYQAGDSPTFGDITADSVNITGGTGTQGTLSWNSVDGTLDLDLGTATLQVGQEEHFYAKATEAIANGDVVMFAGAQGNHVLIAKANHSAVGFKPEYIMGVATQAFANNAYGYVTTFGRVRDLNTSALDEGDILYSDPSNPGALTTTRPSPPDHVIQVAAVLRSNPAQGVILVRLTHFLDTDEVEEGSTNLYFTDARAVSAIQADASWNASDWDTAYGWGDHSTQGYAATTYVDTSVANLVDSAPATLDTLNELAAALGDDPNFATTVTNSIATKLPLSGGTLTGNLGLGDNVRATFGDSNDLQIWHDGSNSYVKDSGTGDLKLQGNNFTIGNTADVKYFTATNGGAVELYHQGNQKLQTTTTGIDVTGNVALADNGKAIFGASDDLQIYHDGSNSVIKDGGTGNLNILAGQLRIKNPTDAESLIEADVNGEVRLYHDNAEKLTTTSTGIDVTGTITTDGLTVDGDGSFSGTIPRLTLFETDFTDQNAQFLLQTKELRLGSVTDAGVSFTDRFKVNVATGDISFYDDTGVSQSFYWDASTEELGLGTTSPAEKLHLSIDSLPQAILLERTGTSPSKAYITNGGNLLKFSYDANGITFNTGSTPTERMRINSSGNVGIGNTVPSYRLSVGDGTADTRGVFASNNAFSIGVSNASGFAGWIGGSGVTDNMVFSNSGGSERMRIDSSGNVGIGSSSPDSKLRIQNTSSTTYGLISQTPTVGLTAGDKVNMAYFANARAGANDGLRIINYRDSTGSSSGNWQTESFAIERNIDNVAPQASIRFGLQTLRLDTAGSERMRIDSSGNVNINTGALQIGGTTVIDSSRNLTNIGTINGSTISNWDTAYGWGDHASAGYLQDKGSASSIDLSTLTSGVDQGWYSWSSNISTNDAPFTYGVAITIRDASQNIQLAIGSTSGRLAVRRANSGNYTAWNEFWSSNNDGSGSGLDADLLDGQHGSYYAPATGGNYVAKSGDIMTGALTYTRLVGPGESNRDKIRVYSSNLYTIGMQSAVTYGGLSDWAMTFQFNNNANRGFWWGHDDHTTAQGAMSLTTAGHLFVGSRVDAPIFYDSDNTAFYVNPNGTDSRIRSMYLGGGNAYMYESAAHEIAVRTGAPGAERYFTFGYDGHFNALSGRVTAASDMRAPIFFDSNNTAYYTDPAGTSSLNNIKMAEWLTYNDGERNANNAVWYPNVQALAVRWFFAHSSSVGSGGNYAGVMHFSPWTGTTSSTGDASYQLAFGSTAANGGGVPQLRIRKGIDTTWNSFYNIHHDGYADMYATSSFRAPIFYDSDDTGYYLDAAAISIFHEIRIDDLLRHNGDTDTYFQFHAANQARIVTGGAERFEVNNTAVTATDQLRTPIIYDLNDTNYYVDPNGTSALVTLNMAGQLTTRTNYTSFTASNDTTLSVRGDPSYGAVMSFHRAGAYAVNFGLDTDNKMKIGGWSMGGVAYPVIHTGNYDSELSGGNISTATNGGGVNYVYANAGGTPTRGDCAVHVYHQWSANLSLTLTSTTWQRGDMVVVKNTRGTNITVAATRIYLPNGSYDTSVTFNGVVGSFTLIKYTTTNGYWMVGP